MSENPHGRPRFLHQTISALFWYQLAWNLPLQLVALVSTGDAWRLVSVAISMLFMAVVFAFSRVVRVSIWTPFGFRF